MPKRKSLNFTDAALSRLADKNRPQHPERFTTAGATKKCEPARRHRCDLCRQIFECHLCTIEKEHIVHKASRVVLMAWSPVYVCEGCIEKHDLSVVVCGSAGLVEAGRLITKDPEVHFYDHLTGERFQDSKGTDPVRKYIHLTFHGTTHSLPEWARLLGITHGALYYRLKIWGVDRALSKPLDRKQSERARKHKAA